MNKQTCKLTVIADGHLQRAWKSDPRETRGALCVSEESGPSYGVKLAICACVAEMTALVQGKLCSPYEPSRSSVA